MRIYDHEIDSLLGRSQSTQPSATWAKGHIVGFHAPVCVDARHRTRNGWTRSRPRLMRYSRGTVSSAASSSARSSDGASTKVHDYQSPRLSGPPGVCSGISATRSTCRPGGGRTAAPESATDWLQCCVVRSLHMTCKVRRSERARGRRRRRRPLDHCVCVAAAQYGQIGDQSLFPLPGPGDSPAGRVFSELASACAPAWLLPGRKV